MIGRSPLEQQRFEYLASQQIPAGLKSLSETQDKAERNYIDVQLTNVTSAFWFLHTLGFHYYSVVPEASGGTYCGRGVIGLGAACLDSDICA